MFAVKGWNVDASSLKRQTEAFKPSKSSDAPEAAAAEGEKESRKRKRERNAAAAPEVDIGKQWERHVEGKKERKRPKKEGKAAITGAKENGKTEDIKTIEAGANGTVEAAVGKSEKKSKKQRKQERQEAQAQNGTQEAKTKSAKAEKAVESIPPPPPPVPATAKLTPMQAAMRQKLISARFRHLNETLYTAPSADAQSLFNNNPEMFEDYHAGFRQQVDVWPENPVDNFITTIRQRGAVKQPSREKKNAKSTEPRSDLPRTHGTCIIADLGCGDARLARTLTTTNETSSLNLKLHSFDLHSPSKYVTKADISSLPLEDGSADVAIFCLALMGTNWISFIEEAYRILHWKGELWVAEIKSRFGRVEKGGKGRVVEHSVGSKRKAAALAKIKESRKKEQEEVNEQAVLQTEVDGVEPPQSQQATDVNAFVEVLKRRGFILKDGEKSVDLGNKMFVKMEFIKAASPTKGKGAKNEPEEKKRDFKQKKFLEEHQKDEEIATEDEARVLKPCLYKIR